ncbi:M28 family metallopeptidase [Qipengyuania sp. YIM B01966]|uniref:M28 family metallopeptidase n=1 Tax=Qipengyuania sp. YIM B01966 TaxID=2778646 RepID=UPI0018F4B1BB|nr:M28 family metallopeptidase [Qipengyuania sp. YIM B01966]
MNRLLLAGAAALSLSACVTTATPAEPVQGALSEATIKEATRILSSDAFAGRAPGTEGEDKTLAYLVERFAAVGLKPGNNGSWFQEVPLVEITGRDHAPLVVRGAGGSDSFAFASDWVGVTYREGARTALDNSELVFVGYGIVAPEKGWNDYEGIDMRGKTAVILVNDPDYMASDLTGPFGGKAMTYYGRWTYKFEEAARQGAAGALIVHDTYPAAYGWNVVESSWTGPQVYPRRADGGASQTAINGWLQKAAAERLLARAAKGDLATLSAAAARPGFRAVPLGVTASTSFANDLRRFASKNVIGVLPGRSRPDEYVLHTAHWDHLGRCTPDPDGDDICNGAVDNASGTAALIALAKAHVKAGPTARSQVFLAVTGEESGLLGSEYYAANPVFPLAQTAGGVNMDALSLAGPSRDVGVIGGGKSALDDYLARALAEQGRAGTPDANPQAGYYYRSDHFSLAKRGVPMLYVKGGQDLVTGGRAAGAAADADYRANRYHRPGDEFDPAWDWSGVMQDLQLYYRLGRMIGNDSAWPNWREGDEFRGTRDQSCAAGTRGC